MIFLKKLRLTIKFLRLKLKLRKWILKIVSNLWMIPSQDDYKLNVLDKVEIFLKGSLDLIPSPSPPVKIQIMGGKVCLRCKSKTLLGVVNKLFVQQLQCLAKKMKTKTPKCSQLLDGDGIKSRLPFKIFSTLHNVDKFFVKVEKTLKGSLDLIPSPSVKIQTMGRKVCLRCKGKTLATNF